MRLAIEFPDWDRAPEWAEYWAVDDSGEAYWFSKEPEFGVNTNGVWDAPESNTTIREDKASSDILQHFQDKFNAERTLSTRPFRPPWDKVPENFTRYRHCSYGNIWKFSSDDEEWAIPDYWSKETPGDITQVYNR